MCVEETDPEAQQNEKDTPEKPSEVQRDIFHRCDNLLQTATGKDIDKLFALPSFCHGSLGPGTVLIIPPGYVILEKSLGLTCFAMKRNLMPSDKAALADLRKILSDHGSRSGIVAIEICDKVIEQKAEHVGAA